MKRLYGILAMIGLLLSGVFVSCDLERSENGDLDGIWKLQELDSLATGKHVDTSSSSLAFAVQAHLLQLNGGGKMVLCRFEHKADSLILYDPYINHKTPVEDVKVLKPYGFTGLRQAFLIEKLNSKRMVLKTDELRMWFEKY